MDRRQTRDLDRYLSASPPDVDDLLDDCVDCGEQTKDACVMCGSPLCETCGPVCIECDTEDEDEDEDGEGGGDDFDDEGDDDAA